MTTSLSHERCVSCGAAVPFEWIAPVVCTGKALPGTGQWRSQLTDSRCATCVAQAKEGDDKRRRELFLRTRLITMAGEKPYRDFRLETFDVTSENRAAIARAHGFNPERDNLYLWGPCGVGKTHLAFATGRQFYECGRTLEFVKPPQLLRRVRRRDPDDEQHAIDRFVRTDVFILDDLGIGTETAYARQIFQEVLDGRDYSYRAGLIVTSRYSLGDLATKLDDDTISSRLAGLCQVLYIGGPDRRLKARLRPPPTSVVPAL